MSVRYLSFLALGLAAAFLVVATEAFSLNVIASLALGVGIGMLAVSLVAAARYRAQLPTVAIAGAIAVVSAWMIVASRVFSLTEVKHLTFAEAIAVGALAVAGLVMHELSAERIVHSLEIRAGEREPDQPRRPFAA